MSTDHPNTTLEPEAATGKGALHRSRTKRSYTTRSVMDAARARIAWLFDEFETIIVNTSGGKDSTAAFHLTLAEAERRGRLPVPVLFLDQEVEWEATIDHMRGLMSDPRVEPHWLQAPLELNNATSPLVPQLIAWEPGVEWLRPKEPNAIHEHPAGTRDYRLAFNRYVEATWPKCPTAQISGIRAEESMARMFGLTTHATHKGETWAGRWSKRGPRITFYPLYDWSYADVWKAIHENGWPYNRLYDAQYQHGLPVRSMRVGNMHHETSAQHLAYLQEVEPDTFDRLTRRLGGLHTAANIIDTYTPPKEPPPMFNGWQDYRDHLLEHLITNPDDRAWYAATFARHAAMYGPEAQHDLMRTQVGMILTGDRTGQKLNGFLSRRADARNARAARAAKYQPEARP